MCVTTVTTTTTTMYVCRQGCEISVQLGMIDCCAGRDDRLVIYSKIVQTIVIWMYVTTTTVTTTTM